MSWSIQIIGKPENIIPALEEQSKSMTDVQSKLEFDSALPHLVGICKENFGNENCLMKLSASGHGYSKDGEQKQRQLIVTAEMIWGKLV